MKARLDILALDEQGRDWVAILSPFLLRDLAHIAHRCPTSDSPAAHRGRESASAGIVR